MARQSPKKDSRIPADPDSGEPKKDNRQRPPRLTESMMDALHACANYDDVYIDDVAKIAVREYLERRGFWPFPPPCRSHPDATSPGE